MIWLLLACDAAVVDLPEVEGDWLEVASEVESTLEAPCAEVSGADGPYEVLLDDRSGFTVLLQGEQVWLRDPFGIVSDRCWWLPLGERSDPDLDCADDEGQQQGDCPPSPQPSGSWLWQSPGTLTRPEDADAIVLDGTLMTWDGGSLARLDLTPSDHDPIDSAETGRTYRTWLPSLPTDTTPGPLAVGKRTVVSLADDTLTVWRRPDVLSSLEDPVTRATPRGATHVAAGADVGVVAGPGFVTFYRELGDDVIRHDRRHSALDGEVRDLVLDPLAETAWVLLEDQVVAIGRAGTVTRYATPGASGLLMARPNDVHTPYAWGPDGVWRLAGDARFVATDPILGAGIGETFQELVLVHEGPVVRGYLDRHHLTLARVELSIAAFAESPRDPERLAVDLAEDIVDLYQDDCGDPFGVDADAWSLCCAHRHRGAWLADQLDVLENTGASVLLGINPTVVGLSRWCEAQGAPAPEVPEALLDALASERFTPTVFLHSTPFIDLSGWVACPEDEDPDDGCFADDDRAAFYAELVSHAALGDWGEEPDWTWLGGGYDGANTAASAGGEGWPEIFPVTPLPDGDVAEALYFGILSMDPQVADPAAKELVPDDARRRPGPVPVSSPAGDWDEGDTGLVDYYGGQSFASTWVYEIRRSGLLFADFVTLADPATDWSDERFRGDEDEQFVNHADLALQEHYWRTRVLAHREAGTRRWWWHLQDLSKPREQGLGTGWVDCLDTGCTETELDRLIERIEADPSVTWR